MDRTGQFRSLEDVTREKARLEILRAHHGQRLQAHIEAFKDKEVRGRLVRNAAMGMLGGWKPARILSEIVGSGSVTSALGAAAFRRGGVGKRLVTFAMGLLLPYVLKQAGSVNIESIIKEVGNTVDHFRKRKAQHSEERVEEDDE